MTECDVIVIAPKGRRPYTYNEGVDEPAKLIESEGRRRGSGSSGGDEDEGTNDKSNNSKDRDVQAPIRPERGRRNPAAGRV